MLASLVLAVTLVAVPQSSPTHREWNRPTEPFRIAGSLYYVGAENITSLLITSPAGHILIDAGFEETAPQIAENVRRLGFRLEDVKILLSTHAHGDHAGGLARLKTLTGARVYAGAADTDLLARGGRDDFAFGNSLLFPPVSADQVVKDGDEVRLGDLVVRAHTTPGHTKGCISWSFTVDDGGQRRKVVMVGGTTAPDYRLVGNTKYPGIVEDFRTTFRKLRALECDICLEGHGFAFDLAAKRAGRKPFVDPAALRNTVDRAEQAFDHQLAQQR